MKKIILFVILMLFLCLSLYYFLPSKALPLNVFIDSIAVHKSQHKMEVYSKGNLLSVYSISIGKISSGDKQFEGDQRTPEGHYTIDNKNPNSICFKNLGISYPNQQDIDEAKQLGKPTGGDIKIHGLLNGYGFIGKFHRFRDWTNGCIAVTDEEMEELYNHVPVGTPIDIYP